MPVVCRGGYESGKSACRVWTRVRVREGCWPGADKGESPQRVLAGCRRGEESV